MIFLIFRMVVVNILFLAYINASEDSNIKIFSKVIKQYYYDKSSEDIIRLSALRKAQIELSKEAGEYISTNTTLKNSKIITDDIIAISASILKTRVIREVITKKDNKFEMELTIEVKINKNKTQEEIKKILVSESLFKAIKDSQLLNSKLLFEINNLKLHEKKTKIERKRLENLVNKKIILAKSFDYFNLSIIDMANGNFENVILNSKQAIKLNPNLFQAYTQLSSAYYKTMNYKKAESSLHMAIEINKNDYMSYNNLGILNYKNLKNKKQAIKYFNKSLDINPYYNSSLFNLGTLYLENKDYEKAILNYDKLLSINPNHINALLNKSNALKYMKKFDLALKFCDKAMEIDAKMFLINKMKGSIYSKLKDYENSIIEYKKYIDVFPNDFVVHYFIGSSMAKLKQHTNAIGYFTNAINLNPNFKQAYYARTLSYIKNNDIINAKKDAANACKYGMCDLVEFIEKYY